MNEQLEIGSDVLSDLRCHIGRRNGHRAFSPFVSSYPTFEISSMSSNQVRVSIWCDTTLGSSCQYMFNLCQQKLSEAQATGQNLVVNLSSGKTCVR